MFETETLLAEEKEDPFLTTTALITPLGTKTILNALSENGFAELAYEVALQETYPSWGWWIKNGATTLYENWDISADRDLSMNHIMFGEIGAWFYKGLAGIFPDENSPGFKKIILKPNFVTPLENFEARHNTPNGEIVSAWNKKGKTISYSVCVPANSSAQLHLAPEFDLKDYNKIEGLTKIENELKESVFELQAGKYLFSLKKK